MTRFNPKQCACGCKRWIMHPWFNCQCSAVSEAERDQLVAMQLHAEAWQEQEERRHSSATWVPKHDKDFLVGQRLIYSHSTIVVFLGRPRYNRGLNARVKVRLPDGIENDVDAINLQPLPGGQL